MLFNGHRSVSAPRSRILSLLVLLAAPPGLACSSSTSEVSPSALATDAGDASAGEPACSVGTTRCEGTSVLTCEAHVAGARWSAADVCPGDQGCREDRCQDPTSRQKTQADSVSTLVKQLSENSAWHEPVDAEAVDARARAAILKGDGTDATYFASAWRVMNAFPQGHQGMFSASCKGALPLQNTSRFGVCGRPARDGVIVTFARAGNALGVGAGDLIVKAGDDAGEALLEAAYERPVCGSVYPSKAGRAAAGAASFFGTVPAGMTLTVRAPDGATRTIAAPERGEGAATDCTDPFNRNRRVYAEATRRPDGVAVIRLPSFFPFDKAMPQRADEFDAFVAAYRAKIVAVFETVKDAPAIVWDARGNTGGITPVGLAIVSGFSSARATSLSHCRSRDLKTSPPAFIPETYAAYGIAPGGEFVFPGKVAVLTDGLAYSAGDYFPFAALRASDAPVLGTSTAGAYGGGNMPIELAGPPKLSCNYDPTACFEVATELPLEATPPAPTEEVAYDAADLAGGRDTVLERAVKVLGF